MSKTWWSNYGRLTGDGEVPQQFIRVGSAKPFLQVDIDELATNGWSNIEMLYAIEGSFELECLWIGLSSLIADLRRCDCRRHDGQTMRDEG